MKKSLRFLSILIVIAIEANSQNTAVMTLNLSNVLTMSVNSSPKFVFSSVSDFSIGPEAIGSGSILVSSNFPYDITVEANGAFLMDPNSIYQIPIEEFNIDITGDGGQAISSQALSTNSVKVVDEGSPGMAVLLLLNYSTKGGSAFLNIESGEFVQTLNFNISVD